MEVTGEVGIPKTVKGDEAKADEMLLKIQQDIRGESSPGNTEPEKTGVTATAPGATSEGDKTETTGTEESSSATDAGKTDTAELETLRSENARLLQELGRLTQSQVVLQGKYEAEVPRLHEKVKKLEADNYSLEIENRELKKNASAAKPGDGLPEELKERLSSKYDERFVEDMDELFRAKGYVPKDELKEPERPSTAAPTEPAGATVDKAAYFVSLDQFAPNWKANRANPAFGAFLQKSGLYAAASAADQAGDAISVAIYHKAFENYLGAAGTATTETSASSEQQQKEKEKEKNLALRSSDRAGGGSQNEKPIYSKAEVEQFYIDVRKGKYRGLEAESAAKDKEYTLASAEGRIR